jgi:hypothetical protein
LKFLYGIEKISNYIFKYNNTIRPCLKVDHFMKCDNCGYIGLAVCKNCGKTERSCCCGKWEKECPKCGN